MEQILYAYVLTKKNYYYNSYAIVGSCDGEIYCFDMVVSDT